MIEAIELDSERQLKILAERLLQSSPVASTSNEFDVSVAVPQPPQELQKSSLDDALINETTAGSTRLINETTDSEDDTFKMGDKDIGQQVGEWVTWMGEKAGEVFFEFLCEICKKIQFYCKF